MDTIDTVYTSSFTKNAYSDGAVSIAGKCVGTFNGPQYKKLAPKWSFFYEWKYGNKHKGDNNYYIDNFNKLVLKPLDAEFVLNELLDLTNGVPPIMLCWESAGKFCHRHLVAHWFRKELGIRVLEI